MNLASKPKRDRARPQVRARESRFRTSAFPRLLFVFRWRGTRGRRRTRRGGGMHFGGRTRSRSRTGRWRGRTLHRGRTRSRSGTRRFVHHRGCPPRRFVHHRGCRPRRFVHDWGRTWLRCSVWDWSHMHFRCRMDHRRGRRADRRVHFRHRARLDPRCRLRNRRTYGRLRASLLRRCSRSRHLRPCRRLSARPQSGSSRRARPNGGLIPWASDFRAARRGNLRPGGRLGRPMRDGRRTPSGRSWPAKGRQRMLIHRRSLRPRARTWSNPRPGRSHRRSRCRAPQRRRQWTPVLNRDALDGRTRCRRPSRRRITRRRRHRVHLAGDSRRDPRCRGRRRQRRSPNHRPCLAQHRRVSRTRHALDRPRRRHRCRRHHHRSMRIAKIVDPDVVHVGDVRHIRNLPDIHVPHVSRAGTEPWVINLAGTQRHPPDPARGPQRAHRRADRERRADTEKRHQCRRIDRIRRSCCLYARRTPRPAAIKLHPPSVMERRETPRIVVHPGPAIGLHPRPMPIGIRLPARRHLRIPDLAVLRHVAPGSVHR